MVLGANWRLAYAKGSMGHENNPDAVFMDEIGKTERKSNVQATSSHRLKLVCEWLYHFVGRADFDFFVRFENTANFINASMPCWLEPSLVCLLALSRFDQRVLAFCCL